MQPIWKDYFVSLGTADSAEYTIQNTAGDVIYSGKAYKKPGETTIRIKINDICADSLKQQLADLTEDGVQFPMALDGNFYIYNANNTLVASVNFSYDWSYDYSHTGDIASYPINGNLDIRQPLLFTAYDSSQIDVVITLADDSQITIPYAVAIQDDYNGDFNFDFAQSIRAATSVNLAVLISKYPTAKSVSVGGVMYQIVNSCAQYALYYVNAYGGWDSFLIEGTTTKRDSYTRQQHNRVYDNRTTQARGTFNYLNSVARSYTFNTSWLTDEQSARMAHLIGSTLVYMYDLTTAQLFPIVITDKACDYQTYKTNGNKLIRYSINAEVAQQMIRR